MNYLKSLCIKVKINVVRLVFFLISAFSQVIKVNNDKVA